MLLDIISFMMIVNLLEESILLNYKVFLRRILFNFVLIHLTSRSVFSSSSIYHFFKGQFLPCKARFEYISQNKPYQKSLFNHAHSCFKPSKSMSPFRPSHIHPSLFFLLHCSYISPHNFWVSTDWNPILHTLVVLELSHSPPPHNITSTLV